MDTEPTEIFDGIPDTLMDMEATGIFGEIPVEEFELEGMLGLKVVYPCGETRAVRVAQTKPDVGLANPRIIFKEQGNENMLALYWESDELHLETRDGIYYLGNDHVDSDEEYAPDAGRREWYLGEAKSKNGYAPEWVELSHENDSQLFENSLRSKLNDLRENHQAGFNPERLEPVYDNDITYEIPISPDLMRKHQYPSWTNSFFHSVFRYVQRPLTIEQEDRLEAWRRHQHRLDRKQHRLDQSYLPRSDSDEGRPSCPIAEGYGRPW